VAPSGELRGKGRYGVLCSVTTVWSTAERYRGSYDAVLYKWSISLEVLYKWHIPLPFLSLRQGLVVQGQGLVNWNMRILKDKDFPWGQQHWRIVKNGLLTDVYQSVVADISKYPQTVRYVSRIYGHHVNLVECGVLNNFWGLCGPRTRTCGPRTKTRTRTWGPRTR